MSDTQEFVEIPLSKGYVTLVDPIDADLAQISWYAVEVQRKTGEIRVYAQGAIYQPKLIQMRLHRVILARALGRTLQPSEPVDHINANTLDNRRANLRLATRTTQERFWSFVDRKGRNECWEWQGFRNEHGYGMFALGSKARLAHRIVWLMTHGDIPDSLFVCHHCDNPACVNPAHLFLGTQTDNMADMISKGRAASFKGERNARAKLTKEQVGTIRQLLRMGAGTRAVARRFGVSRAQIQRIAKGKQWTESEQHHG